MIINSTPTTTTAAEKDAAWDAVVELARTGQLQTSKVAQAVFEGAMTREDRDEAIRLGHAQQLVERIEKGV